jgi:hypothetical protein
LRREIVRLNELGLEVVPELNFSTTHDLWLGPYHRMISTPDYYRVCADLIAEVIDLFDRPRFFHLGFDEETLEQQRGYEYVVLRQHDLWWRDLLWFVTQVESRGVRPWVWADASWTQTDQFLKRMPASVVQSNWHYEATFVPGDGVWPHPVQGLLQQRDRLEALVPLAGGHLGDDRLAGSLGDQVDLTPISPATAAEFGLNTPFFRTPAACW